MTATKAVATALRTLAVLHALALGVVGCGGTSSGGDQQCSYGGKLFEVGDRFPDTDGCNTCSCGSDGRVSCTLLACETCESVQTRYADAIDEAKTCDPERTDQCNKPFAEGLACGCNTFVNVEQESALAAASGAQQRYEAMACGEGIVCGPCRAPLSAYCSAEGRCEPLFEDGEAACKVNGVVYKSGTSGIADPISCNECQCQDGRLNCTEIGCPIDCPPGTAFGTQCAQCGPTDACQVVEHACLPTCSDTCEQGACIDLLCKQVCG
jgi:hypothetical protein